MVDPVLNGEALNIAMQQATPRLRARLATAVDLAKAATGSADAVGRVGIILLGNNHPDPAIACFQRANQIIPRNSKWHYYLGLALLEKRDLAGALAELREVVASDPKYFAAHVRIGDILFEKDPEHAVEAFRAAATVKPTASYSHFQIGNCLIRLGKDADAVTELRRAVELQPNYGAARSLLAKTLTKLGRPDDIDRMPGATSVLGPPDPLDDPFSAELVSIARPDEAAIRFALQQAGQGKFAEAESALRTRVRRDVDNPDLTYALGLVLMQKADFENAARVLKDAAELAPNISGPTISLAQAHLELQKPETAERILRQFLKANPAEPEVSLALAKILASSKRTLEAIELLKGVATARPNSAVELGLAQIHAGQKDMDAAVAAATRAIDADPKSASACLFRGALYRGTGKLDAARADFDQAIRLAPDSRDAYLELAVMALAAKDWHEFDRITKQGLSAIPGEPALCNARAWHLATCTDAARRNGAEAVRLAETAVASTKSADPEFLDTLAAAYAEAGRFDEAVQTSNKAINLAKTHRLDAAAEIYEKRLALYRRQQPTRE